MRQHAISLLVSAICVWSCTQGMAADTGPYYVSVGAGVNVVGDVDLKGGGSFEFDPGLRVSVAAGYRFMPMLSAEIETGFLYNELKDAGDTSLSHVPLLVNVVFRFENPTKFVPFIGVGAGGIASFFTIDDIISKDDDTDIVFAWQIQAGVHYQINDHMSAGLTYKYLGADNPQFDVGGGTVRFDPVHNHAIMASFNWSF